VVFTSNAFAVLGLRALYFLLAGSMDRFVYLKQGLAVLLTFIGAKMLLSPVLHLPVTASLAVIVLVVGGAVGASLWRDRRDRPRDEPGLPPDGQPPAAPDRPRRQADAGSRA
jgi:tellurite resistance protein TerC